jgi:hypothetical protein
MGKTGPKPQDPLKRFESKIEKTATCWLWRGPMNPNGYGQLTVDTGDGWHTKWAHRLAFEFYIRPLDPGETVDHVRDRGCIHRHCVNPDHLDAVSIGENSRRSPNTLTGANIRKTHCPQGHPYAGDNLFYCQGKRKCRECVRARNRTYHHRVRKLAAQKR